jgi:hypothetical protein
MGDIRAPLPVKLFTGVLTSLPETLPQAEERLIALFGPIDTQSPQLLFDQTDYYDAEMGTPIFRRFYSFERLADPAAIADAKLRTNELEFALAEAFPERKRPVNLDPGYLEQSKIVLASTKNFYHRILIARGIYAEVTLHYEGGVWKFFPWTFPDYKTDSYHQFFTSLRDLYREQLSRIGVKINRGAATGAPPAGGRC